MKPTPGPVVDRVAIAERFNRFADALDRKDWVGPRQGLFEESIGHYAGRFVRTAEGWRCCRWEEEIYVMLGDPSLFAPELEDLDSRAES